MRLQRKPTPSHLFRLWLLTLLLVACSPLLRAEPTATFVSGTGFDKGILWKVTSPKGKHSYLFGTIHVDDPKVINLPDKVRRTIQRCRSMTLELIPDDKLQQQAMLAMLYTDGRTLKGEIGPELYRGSIRALANYGMPEQVVALMKPWAVVIMLSVPRPKTGEFLDKRLYTLARRRGMKTHALESFDEQIAVFDTLSKQEQVNMLKHTLKNLEHIPAEFEKLKQAWLARDLALLESISLQQMNESTTSKAFIEGILDKRNLLMLERMEPRLDEGRAFIAVGALHLAGEKGLLRQLKDRDYTISPVY